VEMKCRETLPFMNFVEFLLTQDMSKYHLRTSTFVVELRYLRKNERLKKKRKKEKKKKKNQWRCGV
jgi:hypothetical protein